MTTVTGGSITYARGRQPEQYGNQKAECTLSFGIADDTPGEKIAEFIMHVGDLTMVHVNRMLAVGDKVEVDSYADLMVSRPETAEPVTRTRKPRVSKDQGEPVARTPEQSVEIQKENGGDPNPFGGAPADTTSTAAATPTTSPGAGGFGEQTASPITATEVEEGDKVVYAFGATGGDEDIPDTDLMTALNRKAAELGGAKEINELLSHFVPKGGNPRQIQQSARKGFLEKVHALKAN